MSTLYDAVNAALPLLRHYENQLASSLSSDSRSHDHDRESRQLLHNLFEALAKTKTQEEEAKAYENAIARDLCQLQDALGCPCETENNQAKAMERIRDLIAAEGEVGDLKTALEIANKAAADQMWHRRQAMQERANWEESAAQFHRNADWLNDLLMATAAFYGKACCRCDDGTYADSAFVSRVPELTEHLFSKVKEWAWSLPEHPKWEWLRTEMLVAVGADPEVRP